MWHGIRPSERHPSYRQERKITGTCKKIDIVRRFEKPFPCFTFFQPSLWFVLTFQSSP